MSEGPLSDWRRFPLRLLTLFGVLVSIGLGIGAIVSKRGDLAWCCLFPFAAGLVLGDLMPKRSRLDPVVIVAAPFFSVAATAVIVISASICEALAMQSGQIPPTTIIQGAAGAASIVPDILIVGAIPSIVGAAISSSLKQTLTKI